MSGLSKYFFWGVISVTVTLILVLLSPPTIHAQGVDTACIGKALAKYMNTVVEAKINGAFSNRIKLASPIFNLTNPAEVQIFDEMSNNYANFGGLDAWAGNTYTTFPNNQGTAYNNTAYGHFIDNGWKDLRFKLNKPIFFTEYGELNLGFTAGSQPVDRMRTEFQRAASDPNVSRGGVAYFNALGTNPSFPWHVLLPEEYAAITGDSPIAGAHSAIGLNTSGEFISRLKEYNGGAGLSVEILDGSQAPIQVADVAEYARAKGVKLFLRVCTGDSCEYADPDDLIEFLSKVDQRLNEIGSNAQIWVATGPNEPATEYWAAPECKTQNPFDTSRKVPCNASGAELFDPEFHSLRPYPASPCSDTVDTTYLMCAKDFVVKQTFKFERGDFSNCTQEGDTQHCTRDVEVASDISLGLAGAQFPILGNTELVPNSTRSTNILEFPKRMTDYVSWYLNGVTSRAEEEDELLSSRSLSDEQIAQRTYEVINLSGPLKKLLPFGVQNSDFNIPLISATGTFERITYGAREQQKDQAGVTRHNQIGVCSYPAIAGVVPFFPVTCYNNDGTARHLRLTEIDRWDTYVLFRRNLSPIFSFIPFTSTEDLTGLTTPLSVSGPTGADGFVDGPVIELGDNPDGTKRLYFPHIEESVQLGNLLQNTYRPKDESSLGINPEAQERIRPTEIRAGCEVVETRSNPGDSLYGDLERDEKNIGAQLKYTATFNCDFTVPGHDSEQVRTCVNSPTGPCSGITDESQRISCCQNQSAGPGECTKEVYVPMQFQVSTPKVEEIWERFVAGNMSVFRRMYPKVSPGSPVEEIKDIPSDTSATYAADSSEGNIDALQSTQALAGNPDRNVAGSGTLYFPHIGSVEDYFLKGIQAALRPKGIEQQQPEEPGSGVLQIQCPYSPGEIESAITAAATKYGVPPEMLEAIFQMEGLDYRADPNNYLCRENFAQAMGVMQVTRGTYTTVTCDAERMPIEQETLSCTNSDSTKLSRCDINDEFELAARVLLLKVGLWRYDPTPPGVCQDAGDISRNNITQIYRAACNYYGSCQPDDLTRNFARGNIPQERWRNKDFNDMGYADIVCAYMSMRNGLNYCSSSNTYPPRQ